MATGFVSFSEHFRCLSFEEGEEAVIGLFSAFFYPLAFWDTSERFLLLASFMEPVLVVIGKRRDTWTLKTFN